MSSFSNPIPDDIRAAMTLCPPPSYDADGELFDCDAKLVSRASDLYYEKRRQPVYIDEELDTYIYPGTRDRYRMMIRCMPYKADLRLIVLAAQHMSLGMDFSISYEQQHGLDSSLESVYASISYRAAVVEGEYGDNPARHPTRLDADTAGTIPVVIDYWLRRKIWIELFEAMGYHVVWGNRVLNIKRRQL